MSKIAFFSIPAYGHTNPTLPIVAECVKRGHEVTYYSFGLFQDKIEKTGARFVNLDSYLDPETNTSKLKRSTTNMFLEDVKMTKAMDPFLTDELQRLQPDLIVSDSVCFWGKLLAGKLNIPLVISTTTFAFNDQAAKYIKNDGKELIGLLFGMSKMKKALKSLEKLGYPNQSFLSLVQSAPTDNALVYTFKDFQPAAETFPDNYCFMGPSLFPVDKEPRAARKRIYISLGTVVNDDPELWKSILTKTKDLDADIIVSSPLEIEAAANMQVFPFVNQMAELARADLFITHGGMNSASEGLYMGVPMILLPQTGEQRAVAGQVEKLQTGRQGLEHLDEVLNDPAYTARAQEVRQQLLAMEGPKMGVNFLEQIIAQNKN